MWERPGTSAVLARSTSSALVRSTRSLRRSERADVDLVALLPAQPLGRLGGLGRSLLRGDPRPRREVACRGHRVVGRGQCPTGVLGGGGRGSLAGLVDLASSWARRSASSSAAAASTSDRVRSTRSADSRSASSTSFRPSASTVVDALLHRDAGLVLGGGEPFVGLTGGALRLLGGPLGLLGQLQGLGLGGVGHGRGPIRLARAATRPSDPNRRGVTADAARRAALRPRSATSPTTSAVLEPTSITWPAGRGPSTRPTPRCAASPGSRSWPGPRRCALGDPSRSSVRSAARRVPLPPCRPGNQDVRQASHVGAARVDGGPPARSVVVEDDADAAVDGDICAARRDQVARTATRPAPVGRRRSAR